MKKILLIIIILFCQNSNSQALKKIFQESSETVLRLVDDIAPKTVKKISIYSIKNLKQLEKQGFLLIKKSDDVYDIFSKNNEFLGVLRKNQITATPGVSSKNFNKLININKLLPNTTYKLGQAIYKTDNLGRVIEVYVARLPKSIVKSSRSKMNQGLTVLEKDGIKGIDDGGHLIANSLGGISEKINYIPQNSTLNRGKWNKLEQKVLLNRKYIKDYSIKVIYEGESMRPKYLKMSFENKGIKESYNFINHV
ncbi:DNA/RNA non-specific endonuclease [Tenacibaculum finnmarkense]|uniref:DNA/RNA non-specific endonuclease n=1 Tax=Tenacibaculum finnmarkense TaxID=2781243 RepID=UPI0018E93D3E|nr:DNA/RNA non-specific endonuclease [Tenacibaculum finnmarkense]